MAHLVDGRVYQLFPGEMVEIENKLHAENFLEQKAYLGVVEVKPIRTNDGFSIDKKAAIVLSKSRLQTAYRESANEYIRQQQEGPLAQGKPAQPPTGKHKVGVASSRAGPPLKAIAEDSNISRGTVARWVATARERKFLPKASKGKVSA